MDAHGSSRRATAIALALVGATVVAAHPAAAAWRSPVSGADTTRAFDLGTNPFEGGRHRGVDLAARAGAEVRATCPGSVVVAGRVGTSGRVVTIRCGPWRVSHMPLALVAVRLGDEVGRGALLGTAATSGTHRGLHLGVRRDGDRFGYVDPLRFLGTGRHPPPVIGARRRPTIRVARTPRLGPAPPAARLTAAPSSHPLSAPPPRPLIAPRGARAASDSNPPGLAPWPAWAGLALVLAAVGARWRVRLRVLVPGRLAERIR